MYPASLTAAVPKHNVDRIALFFLPIITILTCTLQAVRRSYSTKNMYLGYSMTCAVEIEAQRAQRFTPPPGCICTLTFLEHSDSQFSA